MDYVQALFSFFIAPLLGAILMGMFWKRATAPAGFLGLLTGIVSSVSMFVWVKFDHAALGVVALYPNATDMAANLYRALWAFLTTVTVIFLVSLVTRPRPVAELEGLVYGVTKLPKEDPVPFFKNEYMWAILVVIIFAALNILFW
jgi:SSS family solute:Na+ symporter